MKARKSDREECQGARFRIGVRGPESRVGEVGSGTFDREEPEEAFAEGVFGNAGGITGHAGRDHRRLELPAGEGLTD